MAGFIGNVPAEKYTALQRQTFSSPTGTSHTLSYSVTNSDDLLLYINNVKQDPADYTASGTSLTTPTLVSGDEMYALFYGRATETVNPPDNSVGNSAMADDAIGLAELSATGTASSSTFLRGDNSWAEAGGLVFISSVSTPATAYDFDNLDLSTYSAFLFVFENVYPSTTGSFLEMLLSDDGGTSYHNSYRHAHGGGDQDGASVDVGSSADTVINITPTVTQEASHAGFSGQLTMSPVASTNVGFSWYGVHKEDTSTDLEAFVGGCMQDTSAPDASGWNSVRFQNSSGTNVNGQISCWGIKSS
jgi:hypothetical protein